MSGSEPDPPTAAPRLLLLVPNGMPWPKNQLIRDIQQATIELDSTATLQVQRILSQQSGIALHFTGHWSCAPHEVWTAISTLLSTPEDPHDPT